MSFFTNKKFLVKLIATICLFLTLFNVGIPIEVQAEATQAKIGGQILDPFVDLLCGLGDGVMEIIQQSIMGTSATAILQKEKSWWAKLGSAILTILVVVVAVAILIAIPGALAAALTLVAKVVIGGVILNVLTSGGVMAVVSRSRSNIFWR